MKTGRLSAFVRLLTVALTFGIQIGVLVLSAHFLKHYAAFLYTALELFSLFVIIALLSENDSQAYRFAWAMVVAVFSVSGLLLYLLWGGRSKGAKLRRDMAQVREKTDSHFREQDGVHEALSREYPGLKRSAAYLRREGFGLYAGTDAEYLPSGEEFFAALFREIEEARRFIFLEFFIVSEGRVWDALYALLKRKAAEGVLVRLMYDDAGSLVTNTVDFQHRLKADGVQHRVFSPMHRHTQRLYLNYRNHQKIAVIDGETAFTGGVNIGDEYANLYPKHGHWKDCALRVGGEGAWGLCKIFLEMWAFSGAEPEEDYTRFYPQKQREGTGYFQPFADGPGNNPHNPAETMYTQIIANAREYVYITTPYLVLDESLIKAMTACAQSGVDIRLAVPRVFDHWYTRIATCSYYDFLLREGVRIFEYTPGFLHGKVIISDDTQAIVGSVNLDYRSLYLHYECGVWFCGTPDTLAAMRKDCDNIFAVSRELSQKEWSRRPWKNRISEMLMRVLSPML